MTPYPAYPPPDRLVADREREPVIEGLRQGFADGRLSRDEFDQRLEEALTARTHAQLRPVLAGLPEADQAPERPVAAHPAAVAPPAAAGTGAAAAAHALGIPAGFAGPLVMYLIARKTGSAFTREQAAEALNFQLSFLFVSIVTLGLGSLLWPAVWVFCIVAAIRSGSGRRYRYPVAIRFVR